MEWIEVPEKGLTLREVRTMTNRNVNLSDDLEKSVSAILAQVKEGGDEAIRALTKKFDGVELTDFRVSEEEIEEAVKAVGPDFLSVLKEAKENIEAFHMDWRHKGFSVLGVSAKNRINPGDYRMMASYEKGSFVIGEERLSKEDMERKLGGL